MLKKHAIQIAHTLSNPSKMPGKSYSLPIEACITGSKLRPIPGTICHDCYSGKGCYAWQSTQDAMAKRLAAIRHPQWVEAMVTLIGREKCKFFRWQDSGDLQGERHFERIVEIARQLPEYRFWLPTKERAFIRSETPENLVVRLSATKPDTRPPVWRNTATVHALEDPIGFECKAPYQGNQCGDCRACWDPTVKNVSYKLH